MRWSLLFLQHLFLAVFCFAQIMFFFRFFLSISCISFNDLSKMILEVSELAALFNRSSYLTFNSVPTVLEYSCFSNTADYTCDKQVLWESAGAFFPRDNSLVSDRKSHSLNLWPWQLLAVCHFPALVVTSGTWHRG